MSLAALIQAGAPAEEVSAGLEALGLELDLHLEEVQISGVRALHLYFHAPPEHAHRTLRDIRRMVEGSGLPDRAVGRAMDAFTRLAEAEGEVHGNPPEEVTFHEVGAADSIADIVGVCLALELLGADSVSCAPLPLGGGVTRSAHGPLPAPGPATLEVLRGARIRWEEVPHEMTTPTGAALMVSLTGGRFTGAAPPMTLSSCGYGAGSARFEEVPNLLRAVVGQLEGPAGDIELLEANVDDASGEILGSVVGRLLEAGALDAWLEPIVMKKGRGAYKLCALAGGADVEKLARLAMRETGTLGVRHHPVSRTVAERRTVSVTLPYGSCRVKVGSIDGEDFIASPEHEDVERLSREAGLPLARVYADAREACTRYPGKLDASRASQSR